MNAANVVGWHAWAPHVASYRGTRQDDGAGALEIKARLASTSEYSFLGGGIAGIGDVDGEGTPDFLLSATGAEEGAGTTWLFPGGALSAGDIDPSVDSLLSITGDFSGIYSGGSVALLGDIDGDGISDIAVGSVLRDSAQGTATGAVGVFSSAERGSTLLSEADALLTGPYTDAGLGGEIFGMGDLDGDGNDDFVMGMSYGDIAFVNTGIPISGQVDEQARVRLTGDGSSAVFDIGPTGDVDGDGGIDLAVIEDSRYVRIYTDLLAASSRGVADWDFSVDGGQFVYQVQGLGDLDADGTGELLIPCIYDAELGAPVAGVFFGADWSFRGESALADSALRAVSTRGNAAGYRATTPGDLDGDGIDDIVMGAYSDAEGGADAGAVAVIAMPG